MLATELVKGKLVRHEVGEIRMEGIKKGFMIVLRLSAKYHGESTGRFLSQGVVQLDLILER